MAMFDPLPIPTGPRRPSVRVGYPWLACFFSWLVVARLVVGTAFLASWALWCATAALVLPAVAVLVSLPLGVSPHLRAFFASGLAGLLGATLSLVLLSYSHEFALFAFLGGMLVAGLAVGAYVLATASALDARRDDP